jgi:hypothetical protein
MGMGKEHGKLLPAFGEKPVSQPPDAGPGIDNNDFIISGSDFNAGGVSAVTQVFFS